MSTNVSLNINLYITEIQCKWPQRFHNGYIIGSDNTVGATILYSYVYLFLCYRCSAFNTPSGIDTKWS